MVFIDEKTDGFVYNPVSISFCVGFVLKGQPFVHDCSLAKGIHQTGSHENEILWLMESTYTLFESGFAM